MTASMRGALVGLAVAIVAILLAVLYNSWLEGTL